MPDGQQGIRADGKLLIGDAVLLAAKMLSTSETPLLDARVLLKFVLATDDAGVIGFGRDFLSASQAHQFNELLLRRRNGEPVAYLTGQKEFWSLEFTVSKDVLIPRDDSECLIGAVLERRSKNDQMRIADLGTGSGCLICALLTEFPNAKGAAVDISGPAISIARQNAEKLRLANRMSFYEGEWTAPLEEQFDIVIANPPYVTEAERPELATDVIDFEPHDALFGGEDGLDPYRLILSEMGQILKPDGLLIFECGTNQTDELAQLVRQFDGRYMPFTIFDLAGRPRGVGLDRRKDQKKD
ncbi:peptide chain release factor N(5)-glutamine methyltransferase [Hyphococcus lacteus]|uniref:Release factor glutamine methyltransferase n=1 Tax=Hyphococcus lacteus TaxID=3143536 RepID=A0ABV3Z3H0_9PROT